MNVHSSADGTGVVHVSAIGELDMATADDLSVVLRDVIARPGTTEVVVDFTQVGFCDSSGIDVLDRAYGSAADKGISLHVVNLQQGVRRVLELVGLFDVLEQGPPRA